MLTDCFLHQYKSEMTNSAKNHHNAISYPVDFPDCYSAASLEFRTRLETSFSDLPSDDMLPLLQQLDFPDRYFAASLELEIRPDMFLSESPSYDGFPLLQPIDFSDCYSAASLELETRPDTSFSESSGDSISLTNYAAASLELETRPDAYLPESPGDDMFPLFLNRGDKPRTPRTSADFIDRFGGSEVQSPPALPEFEFEFDISMLDGMPIAHRQAYEEAELDVAKSYSAWPKFDAIVDDRIDIPVSLRIHIPVSLRRRAPEPQSDDYHKEEIEQESSSDDEIYSLPRESAYKPRTPRTTADFIDRFGGSASQSRSAWPKREVYMQDDVSTALRPAFEPQYAYYPTGEEVKQEESLCQLRRRNARRIRHSRRKARRTAKPFTPLPPLFNFIHHAFDFELRHPTDLVFLGAESYGFLSAGSVIRRELPPPSSTLPQASLLPLPHTIRRKQLPSTFVPSANPNRLSSFNFEERTPTRAAFLDPRVVDIWTEYPDIDEGNPIPIIPEIVLTLPTPPPTLPPPLPPRPEVPMGRNVHCTIPRNPKPPIHAPSPIITPLPTFDFESRSATSSTFFNAEDPLLYLYASNLPPSPTPIPVPQTIPSLVPGIPTPAFPPSTFPPPPPTPKTLPARDLRRSSGEYFIGCKELDTTHEAVRMEAAKENRGKRTKRFTWHGLWCL